MRELIATIDGDGCWNPAWLKRILKLLKKHQETKFTFSVITCYYEGLVFPRNREAITELTREIFRLPNVEPASHTFSHPNEWSDTTGKNIFRKPWTIREEVTRSIHKINELIPEDKSLGLLLLTGDCKASPQQLKIIYDHGLTPFNGGFDHRLPYRVQEDYVIYNQRAMSDVYFLRPRKWERNGKPCGAYYENPSAYLNVIDYFRSKPERPVHVYFHCYAGEHIETLSAVDQVLDWTRHQDLESLYLSEYIDRVRHHAN